MYGAKPALPLRRGRTAGRAGTVVTSSLQSASGSASGEREAGLLHIGDSGRLHRVNSRAERRLGGDRLAERICVRVVRDSDVRAPGEANRSASQTGSRLIEIRLVREEGWCLLQRGDRLSWRRGGVDTSVENQSLNRCRIGVQPRRRSIAAWEQLPNLPWCQVQRSSTRQAPRSRSAT